MHRSHLILRDKKSYLCRPDLPGRLFYFKEAIFTNKIFTVNYNKDVAVKTLENFSSLDKSSAVVKITALWAFSESVLGGILHAFSVPLSGALLSGFAAILISLIALFSASRGEILKASVIVVLIKVSVSPYTPLTAHLAVLLQGCLGEVFFFSKRFFKASALSLAVSVVVLSAMQRILILTIVFGNTLWKSIDTYSVFLISQFFGKSSAQNFVSASLLIISVYIFLHLLIGVLVGLAAGKIPGWINEKVSEKEFLKINTLQSNNEFPEVKVKKRKWWNKKSGKIFLSVVLVLVILSYFHPELKKKYAVDLLIMLLRSFLVIFLWFTLLSPLLYKAFRKLMSKKQIAYFSETEKIISTFPGLKNIVSYSWKNSFHKVMDSQKLKGFARIKFFCTSILMLTLFTNFETK